MATPQHMVLCSPAPAAPVVVAGASMVSVSTPAAAGLPAGGPVVPTVTKHPDLGLTLPRPGAVTYRDVNVVKPNLFAPRIGETEVALHDEHCAAISAVDHARVASGVAANEKWTAEMRAAHKRCFETIELERAGVVSPPYTRTVLPTTTSLAVGQAAHNAALPMPLPPASTTTASAVHATAVHTQHMAEAVHNSYF